MIWPPLNLSFITTSFALSQFCPGRLTYPQNCVRITQYRLPIQ